MAAEMWERVGMRATVLADESEIELIYMVRGTNDDTEVRDLVEATRPLIYAGMQPIDYSIQHLGGGLWDVVCRYGWATSQATGETTYSFDTGGSTTRILRSLQNTGRHGTGAPDFGGAINVTTESVEGCDIITPQFNFAETHYKEDADITSAYRLKLFRLTGTVNNATFKGFQKGEVLMLPMTGSKRGTDKWELSFRFSASLNKVKVADSAAYGVVGTGGVVIPGIPEFSKYGWEYLWIRFDDVVDPVKALVKRPKWAYVERVYEFGDFSDLDIGV